MNTNIAVLRELDELVEAARLLGVTQAKRGFGCHTDEDSRFERAVYESIDKHRAALLAERDALAAEIERLRAEAEARLTVAQQPAEQHPDDAAVDRFVAAMKAKLKKKRQEGRAGWQFMASEQLSALLHEHVRKGDPVDVANFAMMLHQNGQVIEPPAAVVTDEVKETDLWRCTVCGRVGTVGRCCGEETRERANMEQLLAENERLREEVERLRADVAEWKARADDLAAALHNCIKLAYNRDQDELPSAIITTASKAVAKYDMLVDFSAALDD